MNKNQKFKLLFAVLLLFYTSFISAQNKDTSSTDEFKEWTDNSDDEFKEFDENESSDDEFKEFNENESSDDEFKEFNENESSDNLNSSNTNNNNKCQESCSKVCEKDDLYYNALYWVLISLFFTILAGFLVRNKNTRNLRGLFLVSLLIVYGFYKGACPCPIMSFQNLLLLFLGQEVHWSKYLWFLGLIPITYIFGKVWCGWICHLGALQELLFHPGKVKILQSPTAQKVMRYFRIFFLIVLIVQLAITKTNLFKDIDPFKVAFNLYSVNSIGWILLGFIVLTSIFIYRPFCKAFCPIGLILGWIVKIPGASIIGIKGNCTSCMNCNNSCKINAITRSTKVSVIENQECIACGDCLDSCKQTGLTFVRKNKIDSVN